MSVARPGTAVWAGGSRRDGGLEYLEVPSLRLSLGDVTKLESVDKESINSILSYPGGARGLPQGARHSSAHSWSLDEGLESSWRDRQSWSPCTLLMVTCYSRSQGR